MRIKRFWRILTVVLFVLLISGQAWAAKADGSRRVFDDAGLLSDGDIAAFEEEIAGLRDTMKMDVVLVTTEDAGGKTSQQYADDYYDEGGFGTRLDYSGVLYLIDMDNREIYISTSGAMIRFLTDKRVDQMLDRAYAYASDGDYAGVMRQFLADTGTCYRQGIPGGQYNYDTETGKISIYRSIRWYEALIAFAVAVSCGAAACQNVKREYAMKRERGRAANFNLAYRANAQFAFRHQNDVLVNSFVTQRIIPRNTGGGHGGSGGGGGGRSSTHRSSSGRSHGGGGRKF